MRVDTLALVQCEGRSVMILQEVDKALVGNFVLVESEMWRVKACLEDSSYLARGFLSASVNILALSNSSSYTLSSASSKTVGSMMVSCSQVRSSRSCLTLAVAETR